MIQKALIQNMKNGKAPGPSDVKVEILKAAGDEGVILAFALAEESFILNLYKGKGISFRLWRLPWSQTD